MKGLASGLQDVTMPPGILRVDRAAFDEVESAGPVFAQAGAALSCLLAAKLHERDVERELRLLVETW
jgi:hypothetical protein